MVGASRGYECGVVQPVSSCLSLVSVVRDARGQVEVDEYGVVGSVWVSAHVPGLPTLAEGLPGWWARYESKGV